MEGVPFKPNYLLQRNTVALLGGGATSPEIWRGGSSEYPRNKVWGDKRYIAQAKPAKIPLLGPNNLNTVGEGSSLIITKKGKIKVGKKTK